MSTEPVKTIKIPCPFCDRTHEGEFWDEAEEQVMACRDKVSPRKRGDLAAYDPEEFNLYTITTESLIPRDSFNPNSNLSPSPPDPSDTSNQSCPG